jgi:hypothetical protein
MNLTMTPKILPTTYYHRSSPPPLTSIPDIMILSLIPAALLLMTAQAVDDGPGNFIWLTGKYVGVLITRYLCD